jgi:methyl-accepting chemotaxis protein
MESGAARQNSTATTPRKSGTQSRPIPRRYKRLTHENRVLLLALAAGAPALLVTIILLWSGDFRNDTRWTVTILLTLTWLSFAFALRSTVIHPLRTLSNMQSALREGDFSFRVRGARSGDAMGELMLEVNTLSQMLREQRLGAIEAWARAPTNSASSIVLKENPRARWKKTFPACQAVGGYEERYFAKAGYRTTSSYSAI